jgi:arylsulfatase A
VPEVSRTLYWRSAIGGRNQRAVRDGDWKLVIDNNVTLVFNVRDDIGERSELANSRQDVAQKLAALLAEWERDVDGEAKTSLTPSSAQ